ncbi:MAG: endo-1,3-alpha-glucanase family glycosylhydrolase [Kineosporiaceae bacterium]
MLRSGSFAMPSRGRDALATSRHRRRPLTAGLLAAATTAALAGAALLPLTSAAAVTPTPTPTVAASTPWLPFDLPASAATGASARKVFACYFPSFGPIVTSVSPEASDYYTRNYVNPLGENDKFLRAGGYLRDRPFPYSTAASSLYESRVAAIATEVRQAIAAGLDGWYLDILLLPGDRPTDVGYQNSLAALDAVVDVNAQTGKSFKIILMVDQFSGGLTNRTTDAMADGLNTLLTDNNAAGRDRRSTLMTVTDPASGQAKTVIMPAGAPESATSPTEPSLVGAGYWDVVLQKLSAKGIPSALFPLFLTYTTASKNAFAPLSFAVSTWGSRNGANQNPSNTTTATDVRGTDGVLQTSPGVKKKLMWVQPVSIQDHRPKDGRTDTAVRATFREAVASLNLRKTWESATTSQADWVQLPTWNDYSESTQFAPSARGGYGWLDLNAWYLAGWKAGAAPTITREGVYLVHRQQRMALDANGNQVVVPAVPEVPFRIPETNVVVQDVVDVVAFLKSPGDIRTRIAGVDSLTTGVPAGVTVITKTLTGTGVVAADVYHPGYVAGATPAFTTTSPYRVSDTPYVTDPTYLVASNLSGAHTDAAAVDQTPPSWGTGTGKWLLSGATAKLKWAAATDASASGIVFYAVYKPATAGEALTAANRKAVVRGQYWTDPAAGTNPLYKVVALDRMGNPSTPLSLAQTTVAADVADTSAPGLIRNLQASPSGVQPLGTPVTLTWASASDDDRVASYRIYRGSSSTFSSSATPLATVAAPTGVPVSLSFTDSAPLAGTSYYEVVAVDPTGNALSPSTTTLVKVSATRS